MLILVDRKPDSGDLPSERRRAETKRLREAAGMGVRRVCHCEACGKNWWHWQNELICPDCKARIGAMVDKCDAEGTPVGNMPEGFSRTRKAAKPVSRTVTRAGRLGDDPKEE